MVSQFSDQRVISSQECTGLKKVEPQVIVQTAQLHRNWFISVYLLSFPKEGAYPSFFR